jgi:hypothetical protein
MEISPVRRAGSVTPFVLGCALTMPILLAPALGCWLAMGSPVALCNLIAVVFLPGVACLVLALVLGLLSHWR